VHDHFSPACFQQNCGPQHRDHEHTYSHRMKLSIVIPCGGNYPERVRNLHEVLACLDRQTYRDFELLLVEQSIDGSYYHSGLACSRYISIMDPAGRGFNRSWCRNVGVYNASGEIVLLMDGDYVFPDNYLEHVLMMRDVFFSGTNLYLWSSEQQVAAYFSSHDIKVFESSPGKLRPFLRGIACGGIVGFNRDWFINEFAGYNENFFKYGFEDTEAVNRIQRILNKKASELSTVPVPVVHLFHRERDGKFGTNNRLYDLFTRWEVKAYVRRLKETGVGDAREPKMLREDIIP
jgi:glycosyltransferase involved in cell wall biosynthesis